MTTARRRAVLVFLVLVAAALMVLTATSVALAGTGTVIAWNPSHQDDTGPSGWHEYAVCGDIVQRAMALLTDYTNVLCWETGMGLTSHNDPALQAEVGTANAAGAQVFIGVHVNAGAPSGLLGIYYTGDPASGGYAETILKSMSAGTGLKNLSAGSRTDLQVLDPAVNRAPIRILLELGDSSNDRTLLESESGRQMLAAALAKAVRENTFRTLRYEQANPHLTYTGSWSVSSGTAASGGSFRYANMAGSAVTLDFTGTRLDWIAKKSPAYGLAKVTLDGGAPVTVDLYSAAALYKQKVWQTGTLSLGPHQVRIEWTGTKSVKAATGGDINVDALDITGFIGYPPVPSGATMVRYEETDSKISYLGTWSPFSAGTASGGVYAYADSTASANIWFTGTRLDWIATTGTTQGKARVSVDGADPVDVDLYSATVWRQQAVWSTGVLAEGAHTVRITWAGKTVGGGTRVNIDALDVLGTLTQAMELVTYQQDSPSLVYKGSWTPVSTSSASGGSFRYAKAAGASVTVNFTGTYIALLAKRSSPYGLARVTVDGGDPVLVDFWSAGTLWKQRVWASGLLPQGTHKVTVQWIGQPSVTGGGADTNVDAFEIAGSLN